MASLDEIFKLHGVSSWKEARALKGDAYVAFWGDMYDHANWPEENEDGASKAEGAAGDT